MRDDRPSREAGFYQTPGSTTTGASTPPGSAFGGPRRVPSRDVPSGRQARSIRAHPLDRGRSGCPVRVAAAQAVASRLDDRRHRAQSGGRDVRLGGRLLGGDTRALRGVGPRVLRRDPAPVHLLGRHRHVRRGHARPQHGSRLLRAVAPPAPRDPRRALPGGGRLAALRDRDRRARFARGVRPAGSRPRGRRRPERDPPGARRARPAEDLARRDALLLARHDEAAAGVHVRLPRERARALRRARLSVRAGPLDLDRRVRRGHLDRGGARPRDRGGDDRVRRGALRRPSRGPSRSREQVDLAALPDDLLRALEPRQRGPDGGRRPHRALLDRQRNQARDGGRDRALARLRGIPRRQPREGAGGLRGGAPDRRREAPARRRGQPHLVRGGRALQGAGSRDLHVQPDDAVPPHHLRQPRAARSRAGRPRGPALRRGERPPGPRGRPDTAAVARADHAALARTREPHRRLPDVPVLREGGPCGRLAPRAPREPRHRRRGPRVRRGDGRQRDRAHHARLHGHLQRRARRRLAADHRLRPRALGRAHRPPDRARGSKGLMPASRGRATGR